MHTFADPLKYASRIAPTKTALIDGVESVNFAKLHRRCRLLAGALRDLGLNKGDRVAILANNGQRYIETYMGVPAAGLVVVPLNTRHAMAELKYALEDSQTKVLLTDRDPGELADCVEHVIMIPDSYDTMLNEAAEIELGINLEESDLAGLFYTGGTTGKSKGVMLSHHNLLSNIESFRSVVSPKRDDVMLATLPFFHSFGYTVTFWFPLISGITTACHTNPLEGEMIGKLAETYKASILQKNSMYAHAKLTP